MQEDFLVYQGGALKSLSDTGKVGGFLVLFDSVDLQSEYFTAATDYWLEGKSLLPLIWRHGLDQPLGRKKLTHVYHDMRPEGLWVEGRLPLGSSEAIDQIWAAIQKDEIGLSSGSASHLVAKEFNPVKNATEIRSWPVTEASLTGKPVQPLSRAMPLKAFFDSTALSPEQRAAAIYAECLMRGIELKMRSFETSQVDEDRQEMQSYYSALVNYKLREHEARMRKLRA